MLENKKVYVGKHSKEIQEKAFELGWSWPGLNGKEVRNIEYPFLFFRKEGFIACEFGINIFNNCSFEEVSADWILSLEVKPLLDVYTQEIFYNGCKVNNNGYVEYISDYCYKPKVQGYFKLFNNYEEALAYKYLPELLYYRDVYNKGWKPDCNGSTSQKFSIYTKNNKVQICFYTDIKENRILSFKTEEIMRKFYKDFKDLIEKCKPLL